MSARTALRGTRQSIETAASAKGDSVMNVPNSAGRLPRWIAASLAIIAMAFSAATNPASAQQPITIGFSVSLTGGLASSGKANLLAQQIWLEEINAKGGLLGRPVKLVYYDDQTNAATVPGIYAKLHRHRQSRFADGRRHESYRRGHAAHHRAQEDGDGARGARLAMMNSNIRAISRAQHAGPDAKGVIVGTSSSKSQKRFQPAAARRSHLSAPTRNSRTTSCIGRPRQCEEIRLQNRLRPYLPASNGRLSRRSCAQSSPPAPMSSSSHPIRSNSVGMVRAATEIGLKTQLFGGAHGRDAICLVHDAAFRKAQPHRQLSPLCSQPEDEVPGYRGVSKEVSGARPGLSAPIR